MRVQHEAWQRAALAAIGERPHHATWRELGGSTLNATWRLDTPRFAYFVKVNRAARATMLQAEAEALAAIERTAAVRVPHPVATGIDSDHAFLVLEWLDLGARACAGALGCALARMHRHTAARFGWHRDNTIGTTPQRNAPRASWVEFWAEARLEPLLELSARSTGARDLVALGARTIAALPELFGAHDPAPSLVHGDLWGGNWGCVDDGPVVFDPATYYGDREVDIAMTELFGGFPRAFYDAYAAEWPLDQGYARRRDLYNLYHVLNHATLFGGSYARQACSMMRGLLERSR